MIKIDFLLCHEAELERRTGAGPQGPSYESAGKLRCRIEMHPGSKHRATAVFGPEVHIRPGDRLRVGEELLQVCTVEEAVDLRGRLHHSEAKLA